MERFIIRLGPWNPSRVTTQSLHNTIYMMEMRLQNIDLHGILIWIKIFSEHWKLYYEQHNPFPKIFQFAYEVLQTVTVESVPLQVFMKIVIEEGANKRVYNQPTVNEVAVLPSDNNAVDWTF